jgi:hypothetical protein
MAKWQIWHHPSEGTTCPAVSVEKNPSLTKTVDDEQMELVHEFEVKGTGRAPERAFQYSKKWLYDEGRWPRGVQPLDDNKSPFED